MDQSQANSVPADQATRNSYTAPSKNVGNAVIATDAAFQKLPSGAYEALLRGARIQQSDIVGTNGVVHAIDAVILPKSWQLLAIAT